MKLRPFIAIVLAVGASLFVTAASAQPNTSDAALTTRVKNALQRTYDLSTMDVKVETKNGRVHLSGFVENEEQRKKAIQVASIVDGVTEVKDSMTVK